MRRLWLALASVLLLISQIAIAYDSHSDDGCPDMPGGAPPRDPISLMIMLPLSTSTTSTVISCEINKTIEEGERNERALIQYASVTYADLQREAASGCGEAIYALYKLYLKRFYSSADSQSESSGAELSSGLFCYVMNDEYESIFKADGYHDEFISVLKRRIDEALSLIASGPYDKRVVMLEASDQLTMSMKSERRGARERSRVLACRFPDAYDVPAPQWVCGGLIGKDIVSSVGSAGDMSDKESRHDEAYRSAKQGLLRTIISIAPKSYKTNFGSVTISESLIRSYIEKNEPEGIKIYETITSPNNHVYVAIGMKTADLARYTFQMREELKNELQD